MASASLFSPSPPLVLPFPSSLKPKSLPITCGPRDNRGPLVRGRTLSTEAILAVQALKRAARATSSSSKVDQIVSTTLSRLIKFDLLAALAELQRQDQWHLALKVFAAAKTEPWFDDAADLGLYADMVNALARSGMAAEIDELVSDLIEKKEIKGRDLCGPARLVKALAAAGKGKAVAEVYGMMKRGGCVPNEYLFKFMIRGLRRLGEEEKAGEVEGDYVTWLDSGVRALEPLPA